MIALLIALSAQAQEPDALERAYQKEYAYLLAEREALAKRLAAFDGEAATRKRDADARVSDLQARLLSLERTAQSLEDDLGAAERATTTASDGQDVLNATLSQAGESLGIAEPTLGTVTAAAVATLRDAGRTTVAPGAFFLADGTQVDGRIVSVGEIAAFGVAGDVAGGLVPVGEGRLQVGERGGETARALAAGRRPETAELFLFESRDKRIEAPKAKTLMDTLRAGGAIGWVIVALGAVLWLLVAARAGILALASRGSGAALAAKVIAFVREGELDEARKAATGVPGPMGRILRVPLDHADCDADGLETLASQALAREESSIDRFGSAILVIAAVSPLLGLLGTVSGMISTFDVITEYGTGDPKMLSGGISEALVTTELGLVVAIPGVLLGNLLNSRAKALIDRLEQSVALLVHHVARAEPEQDDEPEREPLRMPERKHA